MSYYYKKPMSSFNGEISELPYLRIDNFEVNKFKPDTIKAYFLSHYHTDHTVGLFHDCFLKYLKLTKSVIYCTELTAFFIDNDLVNSKSLMEFIKPLKMGSTIIRIPLDSTAEYLTVTLIPAGHCAGSTMFLFKTIDKTILYTGDFRINVSDLHKYKALHFNEKPIKLDALYIDTTFLDKEYNNFPKRSVSVDAMIALLFDWLKNIDNMVAIDTSARYGYENVFNEIYKSLGIKVYVDDEKWNVYRQIQHLVPGVTNCRDETRIHLCYNCQLSQHRDRTKQFLKIRFSAQRWSNFDINYNEGCSDMKEGDSETELYVCFATHCSAQELLYFKNYFSPRETVGFPNKFSDGIYEEKKVDEKLLRLLLD